MKIFIRSMISFFFLIFGLAFFLQTPFAKNQLKTFIARAAHERGIELSIGKIEGTLPFNWSLKNVECKWKKQQLHVDTLKLRIAVFPLFKREMEISYLKALGGSFNQTDFEAIAKGKVYLKGKKTIKISHFLIEGNDLFVRMEGKFYPNLYVQEGHLAFYLPDLTIFPEWEAKGTLMGTAHIAKDTAHFEGFAENLTLYSLPLSTTSLTMDAQRARSGWNGNVKLIGGNLDIPLKGTCEFHFNPRNHLAAIHDFRIKGPGIACFGKIDVDLAIQSFEGGIFAQCLDLKVFRSIFPHSYLKGSLGAKFDFQSFSKIQDLKCQIEMEDFAAYDTSCHSLIIESSIYDLFGDARGEFSIEGQELNIATLELSDVEIKSTFEPHASPFEFVVKGKWQDPLEMLGKGSWQRRGKGVFFNIDGFEGIAFNQPFSLCDPFSLEWSADHFKMSNFSLDVAQGNVAGRIDLSKSTSLIKLKGVSFPLEYIALPYHHFSLSGVGHFDIDIMAWESHIQGACNLALQRAHFFSEGIDTPLTTKGSLQIHVSDQTVQLHGELKTKDLQFIHFFGTFPLTYQHFPFHIWIPKDQPFAGQFTSEGKLEDLFNFINIGHHRIEGWLSNCLNFSGTLDHPLVQGSLELQNGFYENYYTGTHLESIFAKAMASQQTIHIEHLEATDGSDGHVAAEGLILLSPLEKFPFTIAAELEELDTVSFDTIAGNFSGQITISGDQSGATAKGKLKVAEARFRIPDELPSVLPELPIQFINPPEAIERQPHVHSVSPLILDLELEVPRSAYVEGRGLNAELKGNLNISGTYTDIVAKGKLQLVKGEYIFSGKVFDLTQGELIFNDKPTPSAYISLIGECELPDVNVNVILRGPLTKPKLTFQSSPQLPTSSLLAQILFNKDISEISAVQALQLAQTVISLSGSSAPDILGKIRKTLGIDRLTLVTSENDPGKISLQIGKYLMRGVLLTLSQGAESRNVSVEVDLKRGIKFQAEMNEGQQGKFSLKWHHHY